MPAGGDRQGGEICYNSVLPLINRGSDEVAEVRRRYWNSVKGTVFFYDLYFFYLTDLRYFRVCHPYSQSSYSRVYSIPTN